HRHRVRIDELKFSESAVPEQAARSKIQCEKSDDRTFFCAGIINPSKLKKTVQQEPILENGILVLNPELMQITVHAEQQSGRDHGQYHARQSTSRDQTPVGRRAEDAQWNHAQTDPRKAG